MIKKKCENCGEEFETTHKAQKYCSHRCWSAAKALKRKKICENCGEEFETTHKAQKYCSHRCFRAANSLKLYKKVCANCGSEFETRYKAQKYCSVKCSRADKARFEKIPVRKCLRCGREYKPTAYSAKYCAECRQVMHAKKPLVKKVCPICGAEFETKYLSRKYCDECREGFYRKPSAKKKCLMCGAEFEARPLNRKYCSEGCVLKAKLQQAAESRELSRDYRLKKQEHRRRFYEVEEKPLIRARKCEYCGKSYIPKNNYQKYCSKSCQKKATANKVPAAKTARSHLEEMVMQATMCGLSYGKYKAALSQGKTFEQLREKYEKEKDKKF